MKESIYYVNGKSLTILFVPIENDFLKIIINWDNKTVRVFNKHDKLLSVN